MIMRPGTELLAEHYQKTYELTLSMWEQRNRTFLVLLGTVGVATFLTFNVSQAQPLLVDVIAHVLGIEDQARLKELRSSFPYGVIQSILLIAILYLIVILYHRTSFIIRNYRYLEAVEKDIREGLSLSKNSVSFTREGVFYFANKPKMSSLVGVTYVLMLALLLIAFLGMRIYIDFKSGSVLFVMIDFVVGFLILLFWGAYAESSVSKFRFLSFNSSKTEKN